MPVVVVTAALLLVALASHVVPPRYGPDAKTHFVPPEPTTTRSVRPPPHGRGAPEAVHRYSLAIPAFILLGVIVAGLIWGLTVLLLGRWRLRLRARHTGVVDPDGVAAAKLARRIGTAVDEGLDELALGPVTDAIIACWLRLEQAAASAGAAPHRSDTPTETVVRVLGQGRARPEPLQVLAELYREARFSRHEMGEPARAAARAALEDIRTDIAHDPAATASTGGPTAATGVSRA